MNIGERIEKIGIVPVVKIEEIGDALPLVDAMAKGGLPAAEITFRTAHALAAIEAVASSRPEILVGAGTVTSADQAKSAIDAGAKFIVGPGLSVAVAKVCRERGVTYLPGCVTPTEIIVAMDEGIDTVKFFPASVYGGLKAIRALSAPFTAVRFLPTGGVNATNLAEYLSFDRIVACGGSWMVESSLVREKKFDVVESLCREASEIVKSVRG